MRFFKIKDRNTRGCEKRQLKLKRYLHLRSAEMARKCLGDQKKVAENPDEYFAFSFDFQKALRFPRTLITLINDDD